MSSYMSMVNGSACQYKRLATYNKCSEVEGENLSAGGQVSSTDYTGFYKGSQEVISASKQQADSLKSEYGEAKEGQTYDGFAYEGFDDPIMGGSTGAGEAEASASSDYKPTYRVPNYSPINPNSLTHGVPYQCGGYFNILDAYGQSSGNCTTNFINN